MSSDSKPTRSSSEPTGSFSTLEPRRMWRWLEEIAHCLVMLIDQLIVSIVLIDLLLIDWLVDWLIVDLIVPITLIAPVMPIEVLFVYLYRLCCCFCLNRFLFWNSYSFNQSIILNSLILDSFHFIILPLMQMVTAFKICYSRNDKYDLTSLRCWSAGWPPIPLLSSAVRSLRPSAPTTSQYWLSTSSTTSLQPWW